MDDWKEGLTDEELFEKWDGLIIKTIREYFPNVYSWSDIYDDVWQEGSLGLWKAIKMYKPGYGIDEEHPEGVKFTTYAMATIKSSIGRWFKQVYYRTDAANPFMIRSVDHNTIEDSNGKYYKSNDVFNHMVAEEHLYLDDFINSLTSRQKVIYQMSYEGRSRQEIMDMTFVSHQTIAVEKHEIRKKYKKYAHKW